MKIVEQPPDPIPLLLEKMPLVRFVENPMPNLGVMHVSIEGTRPEVECFVGAYLEKYPPLKWATTNLGDALFVKARPRDVAWGDPGAVFGEPDIKDEVYLLNLLRRIHSR